MPEVGSQLLHLRAVTFSRLHNLSVPQFPYLIKLRLSQKLPHRIVVRIKIKHSRNEQPVEQGSWNLWVGQRCSKRRARVGGEDGE